MRLMQKLLLFLWVIFPISTHAQILFNAAACTFAPGNNLGACYQNSTMDNLGEKDIQLFELVFYDDSSKYDHLFDVVSINSQAFISISTNTSIIKKEGIKFISYSLFKLSGKDGYPLPNCQVELTEHNFGEIKLIQKTNGQYHC